MKRKLILTLFIVFPLFMFLQLAYGLIVREPYPSFMMPGFSRIENNQNEYTLFDKEISIRTISGKEHLIDIKQLAYPFSKIAIDRATDLAFFSTDLEKKYNSKQQKYYAIIKTVLGDDLYEDYILNVRHPKMSVEEIDRFEQWFRQQCIAYVKTEVKEIQIKQLKITRDFKTGEILKKDVINSYSL